MAFSAAIEPLRAANRLGATPSYRWTTVSAFDRRVNASSGLQFMAEYLAAEAPGVDRIVVCSGGDADQFVSKAAGSWLRREARRGAMIGAVADGAFFLTRIRLLSNRRSKLHWTSRAAYQEQFPNLEFAADLYVIDNERFAAAGGIGALEMMLDLMEADYGRKLAAEVAEWFGHSRIRPAADRGLLSLRLRTGVDDERVLQAIRLMEKQADDKVSVADVARTLKISVDTLERDFERITE
jgi:transcriptional regulator GlxA family with amidase domain